jgi:hypothetical protein
MRILLALLVGFLLAFALFVLSPLIREQVQRGRRRVMCWRLIKLSNRLQATMVQPADVSIRGTALAYSDVAQLVTEHNKVVDVLRILTAKMDLDAGITDANYAALVTAATGVSPARISAQ